MTGLTMLRECVITVTIEMVGLKNLGSVLTKNYMLGECAKTVILTIIIVKGARSPTKQKQNSSPTPQPRRHCPTPRLYRHCPFPQRCRLLSDDLDDKLFSYILISTYSHLLSSMQLIPCS